MVFVKPEDMDEDRFVRMFRDPIYGYIGLTRAELVIFQNRWVQRLSRIHQLQSAWLVYPGGDHSRLQHALGTMHLAGAMAAAAYRGYCKYCKGDHSLTAQVIKAARLAGLLHDIGHGPFGHLFDKLVWDEHAKQVEPDPPANHEKLTWRIVREELAPLIEEHYGEGTTEQVLRVLGDDEATPQHSKVWKMLRFVVRGYIDADTLDFAQRDAYHTGAIEYGRLDVERIVGYIRYVSPEHLAVDDPAVPAFRRYLASRLDLYDAIYYHNRARLFERLVEKSPCSFLEVAKSMLPSWPEVKLEEFYELDDWSFVHKALSDEQRRECWERALSGEHGWVLAYQNRIHPLPPICKNADTSAAVAEKAGVEPSAVIVDIQEADLLRHARAKNAGPRLVIYDTTTDTTSETAVERILKDVQEVWAMVRVYCSKAEARERVSKAAQELFGEGMTTPSEETNY